MTLRAAELCAGYNGLGMAVAEVFGAEHAWFSEYDAAPSKILAHHYPDIPNYGDMTKIDWAAVEPVDIISGGTPCQDLSAAGRRKGMSEGTRSNLWVQMREAIATIQPKYVVWENVRGAYSAAADSELESREGRMGETGGTNLRALGRVLGDLSDLGYDCQWRGLRAADVGAPHGRFRVFVLATHRSHIGHERARASRDRRPGLTNHNSHAADTTSHAGRELNRDGGTTANTQSNGRDEGRTESARVQRGSHVAVSGDTPTPNAGSSTVRKHAGEPPAEEAGARGGDGSGDPSGERSTGERRETTSDADRGNDDGRLQDTIRGTLGRDATARGCGVNWGEYEPAIRRWESVLGRRAPAPTEPTGRNGGHRLSARFAEFLMGPPEGWIVDVPGVTRNEALKAAGNGVVRQQAVAALRDMVAVSALERAA